MRMPLKEIAWVSVGILLGVGTAWWECANALADRLVLSIVVTSVTLLLFSSAFTFFSRRRLLLLTTAVVPAFIPLLFGFLVETGASAWFVAAIAHLSALAVGSIVGNLLSRYVTRDAA